MRPRSGSSCRSARSRTLIVNAFISAEDKNFYHHPGIDTAGHRCAAMLVNLSNFGSDRRPVGASTITQQVAKNFLLSNEVTFQRKIKEVILAFRIERAFTKERILELYLNEIYLGSGSYGVAAAALNYFDKTLDELTVAEAAILAGSAQGAQQLRSASPARRGQGAARLGDRPDAGRRLHHRRAGGRSARGAAGDPASSDDRAGQRRLFRRGGPPRVDPALRRGCSLRGRPRRPRHASIRELQAIAEASCAAGSWTTTAGTAGAARSPASRSGGRQQPGARRLGGTAGGDASSGRTWTWRLAVLLKAGDGDGRIGFADGATGRSRPSRCGGCAAAWAAAGRRRRGREGRPE